MHNKPIELSDNKIIDQKLTYSHMSPIEEGFVKEITTSVILRTHASSRTLVCGYISMAEEKIT